MQPRAGMPEEIRRVLDLCAELERGGIPRKHIAASLLSATIVLLQHDGFDENRAATLTRDVIHLAYNDRPQGHH